MAGIDIDFDDDVAAALRRAVTRMADALRGQSGIRRSGVETAVADFAGAYAERFRTAAVIEAEDRARLAGVLLDLATALDGVARDARSERDRLRDHAAWQRRETERRQAADASGVPVAADVLPVWGWADREPSTVPVRPTPLTAVFTPRDRPRDGDGRTGGTSSADPDRLREFTARSRSQDANAVDSAGKLHAEHVYAGQARNVSPLHGGQGDEWAQTGRTLGRGHRVDPTSPEFGATPLGADGSTGSDGEQLRGVLHHDPLHSDGTGYLDRGTESLHNVALATLGRDVGRHEG